MNKKVYYPTLVLLATLLGTTCFVAPVFAFQLGGINGAATIGEPLNARINVLLSPREKNAVTQVTVLPDFRYRNDPALIAFVNSVSSELVQRDGQSYISLRSNNALTIPVAAFRVKVAVGKITYIRNYAIAPQQPIAKKIVRAGSRPATSNVRKSSTTTVQPTYNTTQYGPVRAGDNLWRIAKRVTGANANIGQAVNEIFDLNPSAFVNGDIDRLKQGVTLTLPANAAVAALDSKPIREEKKSDPSTTPAKNESSLVPKQLAEPTPTLITTLPANTMISVDETSPVVSSADGGPKAKITWQSLDPELANELDHLSQKYAALRARYAAQSANTSLPAAATQVVEADVAKAPLPLAILPAKEIAAADGPMLTDSVKSATEQSMGSEPMSQATSTTEETSTSIPQWLQLLLLALAIAAIAYGLYRNRMRHTKQSAMAEHQAAESARRAEVTKKAQHRLVMEGQVEKMLNQRVTPLKETEKTIQMDVSELLKEAPTAIANASIDENQSQIEMSMAHGRYSEAEGLLREVIIESPKNFSAKLRLAEVYYITERIEAFVDIAKDLHKNHRSDISDEDWRRVMRMGKMIAPDRAPFSGPQSIGAKSAG